MNVFLKIGMKQQKEHDFGAFWTKKHVNEVEWE